MSLTDRLMEAARQYGEAQKNRRYDGALQQWGGAWPTQDEWWAVAESPCVLCSGGVPWTGSAPDGCHPCECGGWHRVCGICVVGHGLIRPPREDFAQAVAWGRLDLCADAVRVAQEVMGQDARPRPRPEPECPECGGEIGASYQGGAAVACAPCDGDLPE